MTLRDGASRQENRLLVLRYRGVGDDASRLRRVEPVHLACLIDEWYLIAYCREAQAIRHFAVSRVQDVELAEARVKRREFEPDAYFANRFGRFVGPPGQEEEASIRFAPTAAPWILQWGEDAEVVAPAGLREEPAREIAAMAAIYGVDDQAGPPRRA